MSQFNYLNEINNALTMDGDLNRCPAPRWQRKTGDMSSTSMLNGSINTSKLSVCERYINIMVYSNYLCLC